MLSIIPFAVFILGGLYLLYRQVRIDPETSKKAEEARKNRANSSQQAQYDKENIKNEHKPSVILSKLIATNILQDGIEHPNFFTSVKRKDAKPYVSTYKKTSKKWKVTWNLQNEVVTREKYVDKQLKDYRERYRDPYGEDYRYVDAYRDKVTTSEVDYLSDFPRFTVKANLKVRNLSVTVQGKEVDLTDAEKSFIEKAIVDTYHFMGEIRITQKENARQMEALDVIADYMGVDKPSPIEGMQPEFIAALPAPEKVLNNQIDDLLKLKPEKEKVAA